MATKWNAKFYRILSSVSKIIYIRTRHFRHCGKFTTYRIYLVVGNKYFQATSIIPKNFPETLLINLVKIFPNFPNNIRSVK